MTTQGSYPARRPEQAADPGHVDESGQGSHAGHGWMMICCVPMVAIVVLLVLTGVAGGGAILAALLCMGMMAAMMLLMNIDHRHH